MREVRDELTFPSPHRFRNMLLSASTSFSESQSQVTLPRSVGAFQSLGISQTSLERRSIDKGPLAAKKSRSNSQTSKLREEYEAKHNSQSSVQPLSIKHRCISIELS